MQQCQTVPLVEGAGRGVVSIEARREQQAKWEN